MIFGGEKLPLPLLLANLLLGLIDGLLNDLGIRFQNVLIVLHWLPIYY